MFFGALPRFRHHVRGLVMVPLLFKYFGPVRIYLGIIRSKCLLLARTFPLSYLVLAPSYGAMKTGSVAVLPGVRVGKVGGGCNTFS